MRSPARYAASWLPYRLEPAPSVAPRPISPGWSVSQQLTAGAGIDASQEVAKVSSILGRHSRRGNFGNTSLSTTLEAAWLLGFSHYPTR